MIAFESGTTATAACINEKTTIISIDIGFASKERTTGIAIRSPYHNNQAPIRKAFGELKGLFQEYIAYTDIHLIIEAPLSMCFSKEGNPIGRCFEQKNAKTRYWFMSPGTTTMLAAAIFLEQIHDIYVPLPRKVYLYEGFVTFKELKTTHEADAQLLLDVLTGKMPGKIKGYEGIMPPGGNSLRSIRFLGTTVRGIPSVIIPDEQ